MSKSFPKLLCVLVFAALLSGCGGQPPAAVPPAVEMLPNLAGYRVVEGELLTDYISTAGEGAALLVAQPELAAAILVVDQIISCYQEIGAAQVQLYAKEEMPLSAGAVAIADRNALTNPMNLFQCVAPVAFSSAEADVPAIQPCSASYTLSQDGNEFYVVYAGTTTEICHAFCAELEGCTTH